jgi:hypothetical protein
VCFQLGERLTVASRDEPARISTDEFQKVKETFRVIKPENESCTSSMGSFSTASRLVLKNTRRLL